MSVIVGRTSRQELSQIIATGLGDRLSPEEIAHFNRYLQSSTSLWTGYYDGELVCCWGLVAPTLLSDRAYLWLYTTDALAGREFAFVRHSQREVEKMLELHPIINGYATAGATRSRQWLKWLGARFIGEPQGQYVPFEIRRKRKH